LHLSPGNITDEEKEFLKERQRAFDILQNRDLSVGKRFSLLAANYGLEFKFSLKKLFDFYMSLERLDDTWSEELSKLKNSDFNGDIFEDARYQVFFEQLSVYFLFRHFSMEDYKSKIRFVLLGCYVIGALISGEDFEKALDIARMYSSEIEYSLENTEKISNAENF